MIVAAIHRGCYVESQQAMFSAVGQESAEPSDVNCVSRLIILVQQSVMNQRWVRWMDLECSVTGADIFRSNRINLLTLWPLWFYRDQKILVFPLPQEIRRCLVSVHYSDYYIVHVKMWLDASHIWCYILVNNFEALFWSLSMTFC